MTPTEFESLLGELTLGGAIVESLWLSPMDVLELLQELSAMEATVDGDFRVKGILIREVVQFREGVGAVYYWRGGREESGFFEFREGRLLWVVSLETLEGIVSRVGGLGIRVKSVLLEPHLAGSVSGLFGSGRVREDGYLGSVGEVEVFRGVDLRHGVVHVRGEGDVLVILDWVGSRLDVVELVRGYGPEALEEKLALARDHVAYTGHLGWDVEMNARRRESGEFVTLLRCSNCGFRVEVGDGEVGASGRTDLLYVGGWVTEVEAIRGTARKVRPTDWARLLGEGDHDHTSSKVS